MMSYRRIASTLLILLVGASASAGIVTFDDQVTGSQFGAMFGTSPGDYLFSEDGIDCRAIIYDSGSNTLFQQGTVFDQNANFGDVRFMGFSGIGMSFDFNSVGDAFFEFADYGGSVNLRVNGQDLWIADNFLDLDGKEVAPGVIVSASGSVIGFNIFGSVTLTGPVSTLEIAAAELGLDKVTGANAAPFDFSGSMNEDCDMIVGYESAPLGTVWSTPHDLLLTESGIPVYSEWYDYGSGNAFIDSSIQSATDGVGTDHVVHVSKSTHIFNLQELGLTASQVSWVFHDHGGLINLSVNGGSVYVGPVASLPSTLGSGITLTTTTQPSSSGIKVLALITGPVEQLLFGGLSLEMDSFCFVLGGGTTYGACDEVIDMNDQPNGSWVFPTVMPGDLAFTKNGIDISLNTYNDGSGAAFVVGAINNGVSSFNDGKVLYLHQMTAYFDLTALGNVAQFSVEYFDAAGVENLQVNNTAMHIDEFENMPTNIAPGVTLFISEVVSAGGQVDRKLILTGDIRTVRIGGYDSYLDNVCVRLNNLHTGISDETPLPLAIERAYPNPFNPSTTLSLRLDHSARTVLTIHDAAGRLVRTLADAELSAGRHDIRWDGTNNRGESAAAGVYFARMMSGGVVDVEKLALIK